MPPGAPDTVVAAGAVVLRRGGRQVLLVHRPHHDDWSFPKGKQEPGEHVTVTAVREVGEETGLRVRLGRPLPPQLYALPDGRAKSVSFWAGRTRGSDDVSGFVPDDEIDDVRWVDLEEAQGLLTYQADRDLLATAARRRRRTAALVVVRHAKARDRAGWNGPDPRRPLADVGQAQAVAIAGVLEAYGVKRLVSSPSRRCLQTLAPAGRVVEECPALSEEGHDPARIADVLEDLLAGRRSAALCTHRPVLPTVLAALGVAEEPLAPGELVVVHHRRGRVVATERHLPEGRR
ncbi:MAG: NUDIX hydrolase [Marmoricola sp.]